MPYFRVLLEANGIDLASPDDPGGVAGFFATRVVRAPSVVSAEEAAVILVMQDWTDGPWARRNRGGLPRITVDSVTHSSAWEWLWSSNAGHVFFPKDDHDEQVDPSDAGR